MRRMAVVIAVGITALCLDAWAKNAGNPPRPDGRQAQAQNRREDERSDEPQSLTTDQKAQVKAILSKYNEASLTADDARAINEAFREAGLRNGPALQQAIKDAGFVPEKISDLAPPPEGSGERRTPPDRPRPDQPGMNGGACRSSRTGQGRRVFH